MIKYEIKRIIRGYEYIPMTICVLVFAALLFINSKVVQPYFSTDSNLLIDYYNVICQTMPFLFAPIIGSYYGKDYESGAIMLYRVLGISYNMYVLTRLLLYTTLQITIFFICGVPFIFIMYKEISTAILINVFLIPNIIYINLVTSIFAFITKKKTTTMLTLIIFDLIMSIINIIPPQPFMGKLFPLDANSYLTGSVKKMIVDGENNTAAIIIHQTGWALFALAVLIIMINLGGKYGKKSHNS